VKPLVSTIVTWCGLLERRRVNVSMPRREALGMMHGTEVTTDRPEPALRHHYVTSVQCLRRFATIHQYPDGVRMVGFAGYDACIALKLAAGPS
jgi:hypothetical protein